MSRRMDRACGASFELTPALHLFGSYSDQDFDLGVGNDVNGESLTLGADTPGR